jgi:GDPmannose 4,6-dehydratase
MKKALITGITGQDGSYLADLLLEKGYDVHSVIRSNSAGGFPDRIKHLQNNPNVHFHYGDLSDFSKLIALIQQVQPNELYNLAAQSQVGFSFSNHLYTTDINAVGVSRLLDAIRVLGMEQSVKFYQASTSEMFGNAKESPQTEKSEFNPRSPYGVAKVYGYWITRNVRETSNMFACNGILYNHESPRRGDMFVTKKITKTLAGIKAGVIEKPLALGFLESKRDWGHAKDYVRAMWMMLQAKKPDDYVLCMEKQHSVRDFVKISCDYLGFDLEWSGEGIHEIGIDKNTGEVIVKIDPAFYRPTDTQSLIGDTTKIKTELGWKPEYSFEELVFEMCQSDLEIAIEKTK